MPTGMRNVTATCSSSGDQRGYFLPFSSSSFFLMDAAASAFFSKLKPYTAKLQVSVNDELHPTSCCTHTMQLLQPDVVTAMQDDLVAQLTTVSAMASVAGSAFGSLGRSLTL